MESQRHEINIDSWKRKPHFEFFRDFYEPCYGICARVDCTEAYRFAKSGGHSFFLCSLYWSLSAASDVDALHLRLEEGKIFYYDRIDAGSAIDRPDGTFGYGHFIYTPDMRLFLEAAKIEVDGVRGTSDLRRTEAANVIRYSSVPWIDFTSISHAQKFPAADSCPRITFGKMTEVDGRRSRVFVKCDVLAF